MVIHKVRCSFVLLFTSLVNSVSKTILVILLAASILLIGGYNRHSSIDTTLASRTGGEALKVTNTQGRQSIQQSPLLNHQRKFDIKATEVEVEEDELNSSNKRYQLLSKYLIPFFYLHLPWCFSQPHSHGLALSEHFPSSLSFRSLYHKFEVFRI